MNKINGIIFDLDNTLVQTEEIAGQALEQVLRSMNITVTTDELQWMVGRSWEDIFNRVFKPRKIPLTFFELMEEVLNAKDALLSRQFPILPGAVRAVKELAQHWPLAIVSGSYRREIEDAIVRMGIGRQVVGFVGAEDVARGKPDPEPYLRGCALIHCEPHRVLVFEDSLPGILSAQRAGCHCVLVTAGSLIKKPDYPPEVTTIATLEQATPSFITSI